jgi:aldehyde:ferredoxin oxidoreductase
MNILRINLSKQSTTLEPLATEDDLLGGRLLTSKMLVKEVDPQCEPLSCTNKIIIAAGALAGSGISSAGRLSIGGKSPLTGGIKESNAGGTAAVALAKQGLRAIVLEDKSPAGFWVLKIDDQQCEFIKADYLVNCGNFKTAEKLTAAYGKDYSIISIGQGGEQKLFAAGISVTDLYGRPSRLAARGGLGAVLGSKGVKAVLINKKGTYQNPLIKSPQFSKAKKNFNDIVINSERIPVLTQYGTASTVMPVQHLGALPTNNFKYGRFVHAEAISGETMYDTIKQRGGEGKVSESCMPGCLIKCSNVYPDEHGKELCAPVEYESICLLGSNIGVGELDAIARLNYLCNDYGLDTIDIGGALGVMAEAGLVQFGDSTAFEAILKEVESGDLRGKLAGMGTAICGKVLGVERVPVIKNQAMSAYDPRAVKGTGITYATTPMGADHTAGLTVFAPVDHHIKEGQIELSRKMQISRTIYDSLGLCTFLMGATAAHPQALVDVLNSYYELELTMDSLEKLAKTVLSIEIQFNHQAGLPACNQLPEFMLTETLPPFDLSWDYSLAELATVLSFD